MKLSHLSLAIFSAIALAACGGSGSSTEIKPDPKPDPKPEPTEPVKEESKIVDPAQTGVVGKLDFSTESSVGTTQYIRGEKSKFDRVDNPKEATSATSIFGVSVDEQNPYLTNIALARLKDKKHPKKTLVQYLGNPETDPSDFLRKESLQQQNKHNVGMHKNNLSLVGHVTTETNIDEQIARVDNMLKYYEADESALTPGQKTELKQLREIQTELALVKADFENDGNHGQNRLILRQNISQRWGDGIKTPSNILDLTASTNGPNVGTDPYANGLVGINYAADARSPADFRKPGKRIFGTEKDSRSSTRIFGRNYDLDNARGLKTWNSYLGAETVVRNGFTSKFDGDADTANDLNTAHAAAVKGGIAATRLEKGVEWDLAAIPNELEYVQYGRVTGNLDPAGFTKAQLASGEEFAYRQQDFLNKTDPKAVDTYFYRGPNVTTIAEMKDVAAGGKTLTYRGHALMYGIDNEFHNKNPGSVPTAFGKTSKHGLGNFVEAKVDLSKNRLDDGFVYNIWQSDNDHATVKDALVQFDGNIYGNTVIGEAQRTYNKSDKADFRASFFGKNADELGGSFNSTTWQERYGAKGDVWGGVFGASRVEDVVSDLSNQQLGDIPALTTAPSAPKAP